MSQYRASSNYRYHNMSSHPQHIASKAHKNVETKEPKVQQKTATHTWTAQWTETSQPKKWRVLQGKRQASDLPGRVADHPTHKKQEKGKPEKKKKRKSPNHCTSPNQKKSIASLYTVKMCIFPHSPNLAGCDKVSSPKAERPGRQGADRGGHKLFGA